MTTISQIKETINLQELKDNNEYGQTDYNLMNNELFMLVWKKIKTVSKKVDTNESRKGIVLDSSSFFRINNEELLNTLRQLYTTTKNQFVKKVIVTVGESKIMTEKQTDIIIEEMIKFNLTLNF